MRLILRSDIERWANEFESKGYFPVMISRLVRATAPKEAYIDFPSGNAVFIGGYDGLVNSPIGNGFVPQDVSVWEFGTEPKIKGKAEKDFLKRIKNPEGYICAESTFIFVTPRFWRYKEKWRQSKLAEGKWKDIRVYDSSNLEQWLDQCAVVSRWFSAFIGKSPADGILTVEEYWKSWSVGPMGKLPIETIISGRTSEINTLKNSLNGTPEIIAVKAASKNEAAAFILASAFTFDEASCERFLSRTLIIDTIDNFRKLHLSDSNLNLIIRFEERDGLYTGVIENHHVLVPLGPEDDLNQKTITLPTIDREGQINGLVQMGLSKTDSERFSREAGRNITILKRLLRFPQNRLAWFVDEYVRQLIPSMLIGRWHASKKGDHMLLEQLANQPYEEYLEKVIRLVNVEESPLLKIGDLFRLLSPLDIWSSIAKYITPKDIKLLGECFQTAFAGGNPLEVPANEKERWIIEFNNEKTYSSWVREGIIQSLILVAFYGDNLKLTGMRNSQVWVDSQVSKLFSEADRNLWRSLERELPLLAEAAPQSFLDILNKDLEGDNPMVMELFEEKDGLFHKISYHSGLLWALESLAWLPEYLHDASLILAKLAKLDPGGQLANRPINSLNEIFKTWHYQTLASFDERVSVLRLICDKEPDVGWELLIKLLPNHHGVAFHTHKMRWRVFDRNFNIQHTYQDIWEMNSAIVDILIEIFDNSDVKLAEMLTKSVDLSDLDRQKIFDRSISTAKSFKNGGSESWSAVRRILSHHRSHPQTDWALPESTLEKYQELYDLLTPDDLIEKNCWLFDEWPDFPEGGEDDERKDHKIARRRKEFIDTMMNQYGLEAIITLSGKIKESWSLGNALAEVLVDELKIEELLSLVDFDSVSQSKFIRSFLGFQKEDRDINWIKHFYQYLEDNRCSVKVKIDYLTSFAPSNELWDMIDILPNDIRDGYWQNTSPWFYQLTNEEKIRGLKNLIEYSRFFTAVHQAYFFIDDVPSSLLSELLEKAAMIEANEQGNFGHHLERLLDKMEDRVDISHEQKIKLEWLYMPMLGGFNAVRKPENLHNELQKSPQFFVEVLTWVYRPEGKKEITGNNEGYTKEMIINRARAAHELLDSWTKIPGTDDSSQIDSEYLKNWISEVRSLAKMVGRQNVADMEIGKILGHFPEREDDWPPLPICELIEELNSDAINRNFITQVFNNHGSSSRGPFDGGNIERQLAANFNRFANLHKNKHRKLSRLFSDLAKRYELEALRMDEEAERDRLEY
ncbi:hypothetical protein [Mucilaginibacter pedocola]|uniref:Uncharacterized protein n=1 Tax=Mucilaginibacter pedocola TaxID=1792845 RepID=A0A1S9PFC2_9SPHI|nr:hypothetical protein [Mucilaginibacter pedocola]OOQ59655.1 hypothetical protein BC343_05690 [Mucilaginibacter pedocola]